MKSKSMWKSSTIRAGMIAFSLTLFTVAYQTYKDKKFSEENIPIIGGALYALNKTIEGRSNASTPIYTPKGLPGPNPPSFEEKMKEMVKAATTNTGDAYRAQTLEDELRGLPVEESPVEESKSNGESTRRLEIEGIRNGGVRKNYELIFTKDSLIKSRLADSTLLDENEIRRVKNRDSFQIVSYKKVEGNHLLVTFLDKSAPGYYVYTPDCILKNKQGEKVNVSPPEKKTPFYVDGLADPLYQEDPVIPGGNIYWSEICRNGERNLDNFYQVQWTRELCEILEECRTYFGNKPIRITSAYRPPAINRAVGGSSQSYHLYDRAAAVDFYIDGVPDQEVYDYLRSFQKYGVAISYKDFFIHLDTGPNRTWQY